MFRHSIPAREARAARRGDETRPNKKRNQQNEFKPAGFLSNSIHYRAKQKIDHTQIEMHLLLFIHIFLYTQ